MSALAVFGCGTGRILNSGNAAGRSRDCERDRAGRSERRSDDEPHDRGAVPSAPSCLSWNSETAADYEQAVLEDNVLGKDTVGSRHRTLRYLREPYVLGEDSLLHRALGDLWNDDPSAQPLLAGLCALARDPVSRASAQAIFDSEPGDEDSGADLAKAVSKSFHESYSEATLH